MLEIGTPSFSIYVLPKQIYFCKLKLLELVSFCNTSEVSKAKLIAFEPAIYDRADAVHGNAEYYFYLYI